MHSCSLLCTLARPVNTRFHSSGARPSAPAAPQAPSAAGEENFDEHAHNTISLRFWALHERPSEPEIGPRHSTHTHMHRTSAQVRGKVKLRQTATLEFDVDDARPPVPEAQGSQHIRALSVRVTCTGEYRVHWLASWRAAERAAWAGMHTCCSCLRRGARRGRGPHAWGISTPGARTRLAPS